ncbi:N-acetylglucosamine kinase [Paramaledivibacter caminithermalis]|uniref:BadF-type ATPase n=1 Tax=Paramaledivibacter caminithermalis (strain DSM 15212 / CIP 107654 / DViRD3) TaxID=1121301 RepID=A0A1M6T6X9_PARC5|nr:BadF/BadG/BcrA/BcrD ATPase family protein [Paramaledivibacter caminithermalis]SHK52660.1 BadF-type ATPase [Paramaledivibacter caminithermalis DSM 15212]
MKYVIGIDGGGTKTLGYIGNLEGKIIASSSSGPSNYHSIGIKRTKESLGDVINFLCNSVNASIEDIQLLSLGLAGIDRPEDKKNIEEILNFIGVKSEIILKNDAVSALVGAHGKEYGVITISGTGSISYGMDSKGKLVRAGGWGHIIDDEGSGYDIGRKALGAVFKSYDNRTEKTLLTEKILKYLNLKTVDKIVGYIYSNEITKEHIAQIAPVVFEAAYEKDKTAIDILDKAVDSLVEITETVIKKLEFNGDKINLILDGGILRSVKYMQNKFKERINKEINNINISTPLFNGAIGSLLIAWNHLNIEYSLDNIKIQIKEVNSNKK